MNVIKREKVTKIRLFFYYAGKTKNFTFGDLNPALSDSDLYEIAMLTEAVMDVTPQGECRIDQCNLENMGDDE